MSAVIVPVNVAALCVGPGDADQAGQRFAEIAAQFWNVPHLDPQTLQVLNLTGARIGGDLFAAPFDNGDPLPVGVHLHWALPAALARGSADDQNGVQFRPAPNRWLVVRLLADPNPSQPALTAWILESDQLWEGGNQPLANDPMPQNTLSRAVPTAKTGPAAASATAPAIDKGFRRLGRAYPLAGYAGQAGQQYLDQLTAVGYGNPAFAAAYPHCRNVFGFYDPLGESPATASYLVAGWYDDLKQDPVASFSYDPKLAAAERAAALTQALGWTFEASFGVPDRTVCSGIVRGVAWTGTATSAYLAQGLPDASAASPSGAGPQGPTVVLANSLAEAVAAFVASQRPDLADVEKLIEALSLGLLHDMSDPDALLAVDEKRHQARFGSRSAGLTWGVAPASTPAASGAAAALTAGTGRTAMPACAPELDALNTVQRKLDALTAELDARRSQIYADWCRYITTIDADDPTPGTQTQALLNAELASLTAAAGQLAPLRQQVTDATARLQKVLGPQWTVTSSPAARYWVPNDPVVLMAGNALAPSDRYGSSDPNVQLPCRQAAQLVTTVTDAGTSVGSAGLPGLPINPGFQTRPAELGALVAEAILLTGHPDASIPAPATAQASLALADWVQPWIPLIMQWETQIGSAAAVGEVSGPGDVYPSGLLSTQYTLVGDQADLQLATSPPTPQTTRSGTTTLAARTDLRLSTALANYQQQYPDDPHAAELAGALKQLSQNVMAQSLSGFHSALIMRQAQLQLCPYDPVAPPLPTQRRQFTNDTVATAVGTSLAWEPLTEAPYDPLRAVTARITQLRVIDAFGRFVLYPAPLTIVPDSLQRDAVTEQVFEQTFKNPSDKNLLQLAVLPPRLAQGARLMFRWCSAGDDAVETNSDPATSPIFGWLLYDHLDQRLLVYDSAGRPVATLGADSEVWQGAPGNQSVYGADQVTAIAALKNDTAHLANRHLAAFLTGVCSGAVGETGGGPYVGALLAAIDTQLTGINPSGSQQDAALSLLIGRPLALARVSLSLELLGLPALDQSQDALSKRWPTPPNADPMDGPDGGVTTVTAPVRLGDPGKASDGLVGYFADPAGAEAAVGYQTFFTWSAAPGSAGISAPDPGRVAVRPGAPLNAPQVMVSLLLDPRGSVQACTGVVPVKRINIPASHYAPVMNSLAVSFLTAPVLLADAAFPVPVPAEAGYDWSWMTKTNTPADWASAPVQPPPVRASGTFTPNRVEEGWLTLIPQAQASPAPGPARASSPAGPPAPAPPK